MRLLTVIVLALMTLPAPWAAAQRSGQAAAAGRISPAFRLPPGNLALARHASLTSRFRRTVPLTSFLSPFFADFYDAGLYGAEDFSSNGSFEASPVPAFLSEGNPVGAAAFGFSSRANYNGGSAAPQPLLIELRGDRYVRVPDSASDGESLPVIESGQMDREPTQAANPNRTHLARPSKENAVSSSAPTAFAAAPVRDLPPAVLIFRDGRSQEVRDYTIADGFLYARGDLYREGYWNKKIDLASLDLPETLRANARNNVNFILPSSPNEVIVRP